MRLITWLSILLVMLLGSAASAASTYPVLFRSGAIEGEGFGCAAMYRLDPYNGGGVPFGGEGLAYVKAAEWSPDGTQVAALVEPDATCPVQTSETRLVLISEDGANSRTLAASPTQLSRFAWSPDGTTIAYATGSTIDPLPTDEIVVVSVADGGELNRFVGRDFQWSPDGSRLAFVRDSADISYFYRLYVTSASSGDVTPLSSDIGSVEYFDWSPDGTTIAYSYYELVDNERMSDLYAVTVNDGTGVNLTHTGTMGGAISYSPDGTTLAYMDFEGDFYTLIPGETPQLVIDNPQNGYRTSPPAWSPDGDFVAFDFPSAASPPENTRWTLHVLEVATGEVRDLSPGIDPEGSYQWWQSGTELVFMGKTEGDAEIYWVHLTTGVPHNVSQRPGFFDAGPRWRPRV